MPPTSDPSFAPITRILVPLDGSETARTALDYARAFSGASLILLQVGLDLASVLPEVAIADIDAVDDDILSDLDRIAAPLRETGIAVETLVVDGDPADRIVTLAERERTDLIVMTTRGRGAAGRLLFGSVADRVSRHATVPTILLRVSGDATPELPARILVTLDGSHRAEAALPVAARFAASLGIPVVLIQAVTLEAILKTASRVQGALRGRAVETTDEAFTLAREETERQALTYLDGLASGLPGTASARVLHGSPVAALLQEIGPSDLTIVTSHGASGMSRWLLGSVAEKLVREAAGPIALVPARDEAPTTIS